MERWISSPKPVADIIPMYGIAVLYRSSIPILLVIYFSVLTRCRWRVYGEYEYVRAAAAAGAAAGASPPVWAVARAGPLSETRERPSSPARPLPCDELVTPVLCLTTHLQYFVPT